MRGKLAAAILAALVLCLASSCLVQTARASPGDLHIFEPTIKTMDVGMKSSAFFRWGVYNNGNNPQTLLIDISGADNGWTATLTHADTYFVLEPGEFIALELNVTAPDTRDYPDETITLTAMARDLVTEEYWTENMGSINATIAGGAYIPPTQVLGWFDDPLGNYIPALDNEWGVFTTTVIVWLMIGGIIYFILGPMVKMFTKRTKTDLDDKILTIIKGPVFWIILSYGIISSLEVLNFSWSVIHALELLYSVLIIILLCWIGFRIFKDVLISWGKSYAEKTDTQLDDVLLPLFEYVGMVAIVVIGIIATLNLFGVDVTLLMAGMGVAGLVIAFAAQDTLSNFISGMFLLTDRPFKIGDLVLMDNGDYCRVEHIGMRSTKLYNTFDHDMIIIPNNKIANEKVVNLTAPDQRMKVRISINVDYNTDIQKAKNIMLEVAKATPGIINKEGCVPVVRLLEFGDSAILLKMFAWVEDLDEQWKVAGDVREGILKRFHQEGITIPFPQRAVHFPDSDGRNKAGNLKPVRPDS